MTHSDNCQTDDQYFTGTLGSDEDCGPDEYRIYVGKDVVTIGEITETFYSADMSIGRRWGDHMIISFHDDLSDDKTKLLYGMRQMANDLQDAISYLESI